MTVGVGYTINICHCISKATQGATLHHTMKAYRQNVSKTPAFLSQEKPKTLLCGLLLSVLN
jgi:hypothetical protein